MSKAVRKVTKQITLKLSLEELEAIDRHVEKIGISRHAYLKRAALKRLTNIDPSLFAIALAYLAQIKESHARGSPEECELSEKRYDALRQIFTESMGRK